MMHIIRGGVTFGSKYAATRFTLSRNLNVFAEVNNAVCGSNVNRRGKAYAASVPSDLPKPQKSRKKVPRDERRAMVESYVNKYRATHAGKFPTVTDARNQVGGSYYVIRNILQELQYKSKISTSNNKNESFLGEELPKENESLTEVEEVLTNEMKMGAGIQSDYIAAVNNVETGDTSNKHLKAEEGMQASHGAETTLSEEGDHSDFVATQSNLMKGNGKDVSHPCLEKSEDGVVEEAQGHRSDFVTTESHLLKEAEEVSRQSLEKPDDGIENEAQGFRSDFSETETRLQKGETKKVDHPSFEDAEGGKKEQTVSADMLDSDAPEHKAEQYQGSPEPEKYATDISSRHPNDAEHARTSTLWGNLKSFADGIINMWRKK